jgi:hypothetical protein
MAIRRIRRATAAAVTLALHAPAVLACGFHGGAMAELSASHPRSLDVAIAVREAYDHAQLQALEPAPPALGFVRARLMLQAFAPQAATAAGTASGSAAVLLVESGLWTRYTFGADGAAAEPHVSGPLPGEPVIVTSEAALSALVDGTLALDRAAALGVLSVSLPGVP